MKKLLLLLGLILSYNNAQSQVINWVECEHQADIKVYFVDYKHEADIVVYYVDYKSEITQPGTWWKGDKYDSDRINVWESRYKHQADVKVFVGKYKHEVRVTGEYLKLISNRD